MPPKAKPEPASRARGNSPVSLLSEWVRQGTESFFATQRILLDLVMRQNAKTFDAVRGRFETARTAPFAAMTEIAGEGISNFIAAQRVVLQLAQRQNEILVGGIHDRAAGTAVLAAATDLFRRGVDTYIEMQQHFLTIAAKQTDAWIEAVKDGRPLDGKPIGDLATEAMENFVRSQKKFLDVLAEEVALATGAKNGKVSAAKKAEISALAREAIEAFIDAQKKLLDIGSQQLAVNAKVARETIEMMNPLPPLTLSDLTRQTVGSFVAAQKALLEVMSKPAAKVQEKTTAAPKRKPPTRKRATQAVAAATA